MFFLLIASDSKTGTSLQRYGDYFSRTDATIPSRSYSITSP
jgi:hypothetical protein